MFLQRPHLRFGGLYVSRNTYIRTGITEWRIKNPVHMVCYFRYLRFLPDGRFLYRTSPEVGFSSPHEPCLCRECTASKNDLSPMIGADWGVDPCRL